MTSNLRYKCVPSNDECNTQLKVHICARTCSATILSELRTVRINLIGAEICDALQILTYMFENNAAFVHAFYSCSNFPVRLCGMNIRAKSTVCLYTRTFRAERARCSTTIHSQLRTHKSHRCPNRRRRRFHLLQATAPHNVDGHRLVAQDLGR